MPKTKVIRGRFKAEIYKSPSDGWQVGNTPAMPTGETPAVYREYAQFCQDVANILEALQSAKESN